MGASSQDIEELKRTRLTNAGKGRPVGVKNRVTADVRRAIALIAERNVTAFESWLAEVEDPAKRCDIFLRMLEYHVPKLVRSEVSGEIAVAPSEEAFLRLAGALRRLERQPVEVIAHVEPIALPEPAQEPSSE